MWRSRSKPPSMRRSSSNFSFSSFKDIENLCAADDPQPLHQIPPSPSSQLGSIFHRVRRSNSFARAFLSRPNILLPETVPENAGAFEAAEAVEKNEPSIFIIKSEVPFQNQSKEPVLESTPRNAASAAAVKEKYETSIPTIKSEILFQNTTREVIQDLFITGADKRIVLYYTSLRIVRSTFENCRAVQSILRGFRVSIDERDLSFDSRFLDELQKIMSQIEKIEKTKLTLPKVFIGGRYIGGAEEVLQLHESGELKKFVEGLQAAAPGVCEVCGGFRFILCDECRGSHKCYTEKNGFRSCASCNENGLIRCPSCLSR